jgi:signal transduction histidine kinase
MTDMVKSKHSLTNGKNKSHKRRNGYFDSNGILNKVDPKQYQKLVAVGKISAHIINELCNPIDATNRFINLALQNIDEDSQSRQFLLESKSGVRRMTVLIKRLNRYARILEKGMQGIVETNE